MPSPDLDEEIEAYRDGLFSDADQLRFEERVAASSELTALLDLADKVDDSLKRSFTPPPFDPSFLQKPRWSEELNEVADPAADTVPARADRGRSRALFLAIAASVAWIVVATQLLSSRDEPREIAFRERPLTDVYNECVEEGFKPYWVCEDDALFAATFERRQGVPLQLGELPAGRRMVGLSYLAGISRKSTSLLALANDVPVVVFIDRVERDWKPPTGKPADSELIVKRVEKQGLVFYEVSPFEEALFLDYFFEPSP